MNAFDLVTPFCDCCSSDEEESEEKKRITEERLKAYHEKKSKKPALIAKTSVLLDIKPWDDETDMDKVKEYQAIIKIVINLLLKKVALSSIFEVTSYGRTVGKIFWPAWDQLTSFSLMPINCQLIF